MLGGAGNVARNVAALGGVAVLVGCVGNDRDGSLIAETLCPAAQIEAHLVKAEHSPTTVKTRFVSDGHQMLRVDHEVDDVEPRTIEQIAEAVKSALASADALVLSDYANGALPPDAIRAHIDRARAMGVPVIVDPKSRDLTRYRHADVITPNAREASDSTGYDCSTEEGVGNAAWEICRTNEIGAVLVTRSGRGMTLLAPNVGIETPLHIPTRASSVHDVSGAGDTVTATLSLAIASGLDIRIAAHLANTAAGIVVGKVGTAAVSNEELAQSVENEDRLAFRTREQAASQVQQWHERGLTVGFANGCFDLVHPGHVALLRKAREQCDRLVVALNTDASVKRLKGEGRPVQDEASRAAVIGSLRSVDLVTVFDDDTPLDLIRTLRPDILIKGDDYKVEEVVGSDIVHAWGGKVILIPLEDGHSTTRIISRSERALAT